MHNPKHNPKHGICSFPSWPASISGSFGLRQNLSKNYIMAVFWYFYDTVTFQQWLTMWARTCKSWYELFFSKSPSKWATYLQPKTKAIICAWIRTPQRNAVLVCMCCLCLQFLHCLSVLNANPEKKNICKQILKHIHYSIKYSTCLHACPLYWRSKILVYLLIYSKLPERKGDSFILTSPSAKCALFPLWLFAI